MALLVHRQWILEHLGPQKAEERNHAQHHWSFLHDLH